MATIPYLNQIPRGYHLPDGSVTRNPFKAQYAAEKENDRLKAEQRPEPWALWEVEFVMESTSRRCGIKFIAEKLERTPDDVQRMILATKGGLS